MKATGRNLLRIMVVAGLLMAVSSAVQADWNKGLAAFQSKDFETAIREFAAVIETNPDYAGAYYMKGLAEQQAGKLSPAVASLRKAVELDSKDFRYTFALGQALLQAGKYQEALTSLKSVDANAIEAKYRSNFALLVAKAATEVGQPGEAIKALRPQISADPKNASLQAALGVAYDASGDAAKAFAAFKKAFELNSKDQASGRNATKAALLLARQARSNADKTRYYSDAAKVAERLSQEAPTFEHNLLAGEAWMGAKDYKKALLWLDKAQAQRTKDALVHYYRGQCHSSLKAWPQALTELQRALELQSNDDLRKKIYNQMGYVYDNQSDYTKAKEMYKVAGNSSKEREMDDKLAAQAQNEAAEREKREFRQKIAELEEQIKALEELGDTEEAQRLRDHVNELKKGVDL